jgi:hypothetical protein
MRPARWPRQWRPHLQTSPPFGSSCAQARRVRSRTSEPDTPCMSTLLETDEARIGQHPLLPSGQGAASLPFR